MKVGGTCLPHGCWRVNAGHVVEAELVTSWRLVKHV